MRGAILALVAMAGCPCLSSAAGEREACVVISQETDTTKEAVGALRARWRGGTTVVVMAQEASREQAWSRISAPGFAVHVAIGSEALELCSRLPADRPVLYAMVLDPERYVASRSNVGGVLMLPPARLELETLHEIAPKLRRILTIYSPLATGKRVEEGTRAAKDLGVELEALPADSPESAARLLRDHKDDFDAYWMLPDQRVVSSEVVQYLLLLSYQRKAPVVAATRKLVEKGFLFCLSPVASEVGTLLGNLVSTVADGGKPETVAPVEPELALNLKTAQSLGIDVPRVVKSRAKAVY